MSVLKSENEISTKNGYTFTEEISYSYVGYKDILIALLYKFPKDINRFH